MVRNPIQREQGHFSLGFIQAAPRRQERLAARGPARGRDDPAEVGHEFLQRARGHQPERGRIGPDDGQPGQGGGHLLLMVAGPRGQVRHPRGPQPVHPRDGGAVVIFHDPDRRILKQQPVARFAFVQRRLRSLALGQVLRNAQHLFPPLGGKDQRGHFHPQQPAVPAAMGEDPGQIRARLHRPHRVLQVLPLVLRPDVRQRHAHELLPGIAVQRDRRVVNREKLQRLPVIDPHRIGVRQKQPAVAFLALAQCDLRLLAGGDIRDKALDRDQPPDGVAHRAHVLGNPPRGAVGPADLRLEVREDLAGTELGEKFGPAARTHIDAGGLGGRHAQQLLHAAVAEDAGHRRVGRAKPALHRVLIDALDRILEQEPVQVVLRTPADTDPAEPPA